MDRYGLQYYLNRSREPGYIAIVLESGKNIAGVALVIVSGSVITVEMLAKNCLVNERKVGVRLLGCIEECIADQLGVNWIRLDSLNREKLTAFYRSRGFVDEGPQVYDREWGFLQPMYKRIAGVSG